MRDKDGTVAKAQKKDMTHKYRRCGRMCSSHYGMCDHRKRVHYQFGGNASSLISVPWSDGKEPWQNEDGSLNEAFKKLYDQHRNLILIRKQSKPSEAVSITISL